MAGGDSCGHRFDDLPVTDVARLVLGTELPGDACQPLCASRDEDALPAACRQQPRERGADAARAACDDRDRQRQQTRTRRRASASRPAVSETMAVSACGPFFAPPVRQIARKIPSSDFLTRATCRFPS